MNRQIFSYGWFILIMVIKMIKKIINSLVIPVVVAVFCGFLCGKFVYKSYNLELQDELKSSRLYLIQSGQYLTYERMREENSGNNYVYYKDEDGYKTIIGITKNYDNIDKIKSLYSEDMVVDEYYVPWEYIDEKQDEYERQLNDTDNIYEVKEIVDNILNLYRSDDSIKLISIN